MKELELLQQKLDLLMKRFFALQADKERLELANGRQAAIIKEQEERLAVLETELQLRSVARSAAGDHAPDDATRLKKHLDQVIKEIEKNIELL